MGRLKRSCVVGSVVFHTLILAMLVLGPMLLAKREEKVRVIDLVPSEVIDKLLAPAAPVAPPPAPAPPKPKPEPKKIQPKPKPKPVLPKPEPKKIQPKPKPKPVLPKPKPKKNTPKPKPKPKPKIKVNLDSSVRKPDAQNTEAEKEMAKRRKALNRSLNKLDTKLSGRTAVNVPLGRFASANYESLIRRKYMDATIHPGAISGREGAPGHRPQRPGSLGKHHGPVRRDELGSGRAKDARPRQVHQAVPRVDEGGATDLQPEF